MKEKIMLLSWLLFVWVGIYLLAAITNPQQYNYNGGLVKNVYAAVAPDTNNTFNVNPTWNRTVEEVTVQVASESVDPTPIAEVIVPPPPRHSH